MQKMRKDSRLFITGIILIIAILNLSFILASDTDSPEAISFKSCLNANYFSNNDIQIISPENSNEYDNNRIRLNIIPKEKCDLEYSDNVIKKENWILGGCVFPFPKENYKPLCKNCYEYNKSLSFKDGIHILSVRCANKNDISSIVFFVDRNNLRVLEVSKKDNSFVNGDEFSVKYNENLVLSAIIQVKEVCKNPGFCKTKDFDAICELGKSECNFPNLDLSWFEGKEIEYKYIVHNLAGKSAESKAFRAFVDSINPMIRSFSYSTDKTRAFFNLDIEEGNLAKIEYIDYHSRTPVWRTLCDFEQSSKCDAVVGISKGIHFFDIRVTDKAGNIGKYIKVSKNNEVVLGNESAPVTIVMFGDYESLETKSFFDETYPQLKEKYFDKNRVNLVFRNYPNEANENSELASVAAECVRRLSGDDKFWEMHNLVLENQENLSEERLIGLAESVSNSTEISDCIEFRETQEIVDNDIQDGKDAGVFMTPMFFINKEVIIGNEGFDAWKKVLNQEYIDCKKGNCWTISKY